MRQVMRDWDEGIILGDFPKLPDDVVRVVVPVHWHCQCICYEDACNIGLTSTVDVGPVSQALAIESHGTPRSPLCNHPPVYSYT
jgi:hypothetical protein